MIYKTFLHLLVVWVISLCLALGFGVLLTLAYLNFSIGSTLGVF